MDVALEDYTRGYILQVINKFQSLFSWMLRSKNAHTRDPAEVFEVSILVLVDVALEDQNNGVDALRVLSFNPCSRGCCARRICVVRREYTMFGFNPCSRGCCARSPHIVIPAHISDGFNPCSRGCCARRLDRELVAELLI